MTMDNGDGRTHEDAESGQENAPNWYFDLPGGAWERQEEKNRNLRERVLGNIQEDAEKTKADPFARKFEVKPGDTAPSKFELRRPEPEQKKGRFLGLGKKKSNNERSDAPREHDREAEMDAGDWSTEPPLTLSTPAPAEKGVPPLRTRPAGERTEPGPTFGAGEPGSVDGDQDFASRMRAWAQRSAAPDAGDAGHGEGAQPRAESDPAHPAGMPLTHPSEGGTASSGSSTSEPTAPAETTPVAPAAREGDERSREGMSFDSMRAWAESGRGKEHPHFTTTHHETAAEDEDTTTAQPIPLRPRAHEEGEDEGLAAMFVADGPDEVAPAPDADTPRVQPLVLRPRNEQAPPREVEPEVAQPRSKWDEFFNIGNADDADAGESEGEGLAAMRAWAQKGADNQPAEEVPEAFLKPFDWELQEDGTRAGAQHTQGLELVKASGWAPEDEPADDSAEPHATTWEEAAPFLGHEESAAEPTAAEMSVPEVEDVPTAEAASEDDDEALAGLFEEARAAALRDAAEKGKGGRFGRLFGRKKADSHPQDDASEDGDWVLPEGAGSAPTSISESEWIEAEHNEPNAAGVAPAQAETRIEWEPEPVEQPAATVPLVAVEAGHDAPADAADMQVVFRGDDEEWDPEPLSEPDWLTAQAPWDVEEAGTQPSPVADVPAQAVASVDTVAEAVVAEQPVEAVASVDTVVEEPVAETPWWEQQAEKTPAVEQPVEAVASVDAVVEESVAESPWWEQQPEEISFAETPVQAVASVDAVVEEPAAETPWWEQQAEETPAVEPAVEAVASADAVVEEPAAEPPVEAVASVDAAVEESVAESPWWEQQPEEIPVAETPVEAVASVDAAVEEPVAESPWWEQRPEEIPVAETPVEAVASVDAAVEESVAESPWWEQQPEEIPVAETPVEAVASVDAVVEEPVAEEPVAETPWWEQRAEETSAVGQPDEAVASVDAVVEEPVAEAPQWEKPALEMPVSESPAQPVASAETFFDGSEEVLEEPVSALPAGAGVESQTQPEDVEGETTESDDDPWAEFVASPGTARSVPPAAAPAFSTTWSATPAPEGDDDMWGHVAATAESGAGADDDALDLAASLEDQMEEARAAQTWPGHPEEQKAWPAESPEDDSAFVPEDEEDVILAAFERHAATPDATAPADDGALAELLGERADEIVASALEEGAGEKSFLRLTGWAPQRGSEYYDDGWVDEDATRPALGGTDGAGFAPPPWAAEELEADEAATPRGHHRTRTWIREIVETSLLALLVFLSVRASFQNFKVEGSSMYPTLEDGEFLIVNKLVYSEVDMEKLSNFLPFVDAGSDPKRNVFHGPQRGDIVVMVDPRDKNTDLIKRVIGLPGETIEIVDGKVYINDFLLEEPYIKQAWNDNKPKITIPPGEYFVMGDNRENSLDSRSSQVGLVPKDLIIGKAMVSYWPTSKFGFAPNESGTLTEAKPTLTTRRIGQD